MSPACDRVIFEMDDQRFDLCASCRQVVLETMTGKVEGPARDEQEKPSTGKRGKKSG
jgi:hypothetical protein